MRVCWQVRRSAKQHKQSSVASGSHAPIEAANPPLKNNIPMLTNSSLNRIEVITILSSEYHHLCRIHFEFFSGARIV